MAESSYPQPGLKPGDGPDCGAYTANQWRGLLNSMMRSSGMVQSIAPVLPTVAQHPDVGVFYAVPNRLEVTSPGASQISIATGASLVDGTLHYSDTAHTAVAITNPGANPRIDVVVVRQNYTGIDYQSVNTPAGTLLVTANTARIAIISGAEAGAPVAPGLTQDTTRATYWDIPLAQYEIAVGGAITNLTDRREWVDAETKRIFAPFVYGAVAAVEVIQTQYGVMIDTGMATLAYARTAVPKNFISGMLATPIIIKDTAAAGNLQIGNFVAQYGTCDEALPHTDQSGVTVIAIAGAASTIKCLTDVQLALSNAAIDDYICFYLQRDNAGTYAASLYAMGVDIEYLGWGRK